MKHLPMVFDRSVIRSGDIIQVQTSGLVGRGIQRVLDYPYNHDAGADFERNGDMVILESKPPRSCITPVEFYEERMLTGEYKVRVLRPLRLSEDVCLQACDEWREHVLNLPYDWGAFPRLLIKATLMDVFDSAAGMRWCFYCTEGWQDSYRRAAGPRDEPWGGLTNRTPMHTGKLIAITFGIVHAAVIPA